MNDIIDNLFERLDALKGEEIAKNMKFRALFDLFNTFKSLGLTSLYKVFLYFLELTNILTKHNNKKKLN